MLRRAAQLVDRYSYVCLLAAAPFLLFPSPGRSWALLLLPAVWGAAWLVRGAPLPATPLNVPLLGLCLMMLVSLYATYSIEVSLPKLAGLLLGLASFWVTVRWIDHPRRLRMAVYGFVLAGAGLAALALIGTDWPPKFPLFDRFVQWLPRLVRDLPGAQEGFQPNVVGGVLVLFVPLQLALLTKPKWFPGLGAVGRRWLLGAQFVLLALTGGVLALTQSRGAWLGMGAALIALIAWQGARSRRMLAVVLGLALILVVLAGPRNVWNRLSGVLGPEVGIRVDSRWAMWQRGLYGLQDFPFTGMGMNTFRFNLLSLYPMYVMPPTLDLAHAHNHLLQVGLDLGLPGLVAYVALWLAVAYMLLRTHRTQDAGWPGAVSRGLGAGLLAHFIFGLTDAIPLGGRPGIVFWLVLALVTGLYQVVNQSKVTT